MNTKVKKTKNCIEPWRSFQFEAGGNITPCCSGTISGNFGNINTEYFGRKLNDQHIDIFANKAYRHLRKALLTGELPGACISCRSVHDDDITIDELRQRVINHLESQGVKTNGADLTREYAFSECGGNITNKCNFSCIYCSHSGESGHSGYFATEMDQARFQELIDFLCCKGLKIFNFCGIGELTTYPGWQDLCEKILRRHPQLRLRMISNFGKRLSDSELVTLAKLDLIHISCDTLDDKIYAWLRKGGRLPILLDNIRRLKTRFTENPNKDPKLVFNVTVTDKIIDHLEELFRFAADNTMFVHLSSLFVMNGSVASNTGCVKKISDMDDAHISHVREILCDLPRRMKAQNPLTNVWEYKFIYKKISQKADEVTLNKFVPDTDEVVYELFYKNHPQNTDAYLRKIWLSFDDVLKGIYIAAGKAIKIELPSSPGKLVYRATWCRDRLDGNLDIFVGSIGEIVTNSELSISANNCLELYNNVLFEVISFEPEFAIDKACKLLKPMPLPGSHPSVLVREAFLGDEEELITRRLVESKELLVIWCAGLKTLQLLSNTCLGQANIHMIIDGNPERTGQLFCGRTIHGPDDIHEFHGKILVIHASCPEQVELQIRSMGITNEILIL